MTWTTKLCKQTPAPLCVLGTRSQEQRPPMQLVRERRMRSLLTERSPGRRTMSQKNPSLRPRAGFNPEACGSSMMSNVEPGVEVARQRFIKAYLRRPVLEQVELGDHQPSSLAEALERAECMLASIESVAA